MHFMILCMHIDPVACLLHTVSVMHVHVLAHSASTVRMHWTLSTVIASAITYPVLSNFDKELMFAHLKELVIYTHLYCDDEERSLVKGSRINVYQESLSSEYKNAREVLLNLISTCSKYLEEWPEHPVLNKVC